MPTEDWTGLITRGNRIRIEKRYNYNSFGGTQKTLTEIYSEIRSS